LNSADSIELRQIRGIGAFRAKILIERREQIGGYYSLDQLYDDLYSIDSADVQQIKPYLYVDESYTIILTKIWQPLQSTTLSIEIKELSSTISLIVAHCHEKNGKK